MIEQLASASDAELLAEMRSLEVELCQAQFRQLSVLAELSARNVPGSLGLRGLADLVAGQVRCSPAEARRRAKAVERFGARRAVTGEVLEPVYPATAEALADGAIGSEHAAAIADTVDKIPVADRAVHAEAVETTLLEHARVVDPRTVKLLGERILAHLDPDGPSPDEERVQQSHRSVSLNRLPDSTGLLYGQLTPTCQAIWEAVLTPLAARRPDDTLGPDDRTPGQRLHDALEEAGRRLLKSGGLPDHAGLPAQLIITLTLTDLERRAGRATTHHGGTLTIDQALKLAAAGELLPAILDDAGGILAYGRSRRLASTGQRKALFARDRGCTFPGCNKTAAQSEIHHTTDWARGGTTDLRTMAIACGYHNNEGPKQGWQTLMIDVSRTGNRHPGTQTNSPCATTCTTLSYFNPATNLHHRRSRRSCARSELAAEVRKAATQRGAKDRKRSPKERRASRLGSSVQAKSGRPANTPTPIAHAVSSNAAIDDRTVTIGFSFPLLLDAMAAGLVEPRTRLACLTNERPTKATTMSAPPGFEPSTPAPSLSRRTHKA